MKTLNSFLTALVIIVVFSSCTPTENFIEDETSEQLLKSYTLKRDKSGAYSLDYNLIDGATAENIKNSETNANEIYLYSSGGAQSKNAHSEELQIENDQLTVGFIDTNSEKKRSQITIIDDNIVLARGGEEEFLNEYSVTSNEDGTYSLNFNVKDDVEVDFVYNVSEDKYEIYLTDGTGNESSDFSRTFTKEEGVDLRIGFLSQSTSQESITQVPVIIVND